MLEGTLAKFELVKRPFMRKKKIPMRVINAYLQTSPNRKKFKGIVFLKFDEAKYNQKGNTK